MGLELKLSTSQVEDFGYILISLNVESYDGSQSDYITISRKNLLTESTKEITKIDNIQVQNYIFHDYSCDCCVPYQYICEYSQDSTIKDEGTITTLIPNGAFITDGDKQLRVIYNLGLSNIKYNIIDSVVPTLGSKYPFFRRNGNQKYRTFTISGMISYESEIEKGANGNITSSSFFSDVPIVDNDYTNLNDYDRKVVYEKLFRDKVKEFLLNSNIKLLKTKEEGNILVKLINITFTPKKEWEQVVYDFSAEAIECADYTDAYFAVAKNEDNIYLIKPTIGG